MSLAESLTAKILRLRQTAEAIESGKRALPASSKKRKSSELLTRTTSVSTKDGEVKKVDADFQALLQTYRDRIDQVNSDKEKKQKEFSEFKQNLDDLRAAYLYGLQKVSALKDLQDAPDAILFGNFPKTSEDEEEAVEVKDESAT